VRFPWANSATAMPRRQNTEAVKMRRLKKADCEVDFFFIDGVSFSLRSRVAILSDLPEACQHFFKVFPKFSLKDSNRGSHKFHRMIQGSDISRQLVAILLFRGNVTILLPYGVPLSTGKVCPAGGRAKKRQSKDAPSAHLPVPGNFWPTKYTHNTNDEDDEARMTNDEGAVSSRWSCPCSGAIP
jgi:hypothetical protein